MLSFLFGIVSLVLTSFYSLQFSDIDGASVFMSNYQQKKLLLVTIATGSARVNQLGELQQLQQQFGDSLIIIAFPSNSFGHEPRSGSAIKQFCQSNYGVTYKIAALNGVAGTTVQPVFQWLASSSANGMMDAVAGADFQKFLINKNGQLVGVFAPSVSPLHQTVTDAIAAQD